MLTLSYGIMPITSYTSQDCNPVELLLWHEPPKQNPSVLSMSANSQMELQSYTLCLVVCCSL